MWYFRVILARYQITYPSDPSYNNRIEIDHGSHTEKFEYVPCHNKGYCIDQISFDKTFYKVRNSVSKNQGL